MTIAAPSRRELGALLAILLIAAAIRILTADYPLWFDELASLVFAGEPLHRLWSGWMVRETNPPLYYSLLRGWIALFGDADRTLRLFSLLIGLTGIAAACAIARRIGGATAGLAAAALLAVSAAHVDISQQVRGYALADTAALVAMLGMVRFLDRERIVDLFVYAIAALVALYAHTTMIVFVALANVAVLLLVRRRTALMSWLMANAIVALGWAWWGWITFVQATGAQSTIGWIAKPTFSQATAITEQAYLPTYLASSGARRRSLPLCGTGRPDHRYESFAWRRRYVGRRPVRRAARRCGRRGRAAPAGRAALHPDARRSRSGQAVAPFRARSIAGHCQRRGTALADPVDSDGEPARAAGR